MEGNLKENGWFLSSEGIAECKKACTKENPTASEYLKAATNLDLKQYGTRFLPEDIAKGKIESIEGPGVLQIQKLRNIAAPRSNEESNHAPRLLKFQLTDGPVSCQGLEYAAISDISLSTPPGTKICLIGSVPVRNGALLLDKDNTRVLGGEVESLVCRWKLNKSLAKHSRATPSGEGGPPPFVPFNQAKTQENRGKSNSDQNRGSPTVANGHVLEKHSNHDHSDSKKQPENTRYKQQDNLPRKGRDHDKDGERERHFETSHKRDERGDQRGRPRGDFRGDSRGEPRRYNQDRAYGKFTHDGRPNQRDNRGNYRGGNRNYDSSMGTSQSGDARIANNGGDRNNPRRTDHNRPEKGERPSQVSQANDSTGSQKSDSNRSRSSSGIRENGASDTQSRDSSEVQAPDESTSRPHDVQGSKVYDGPGRGGPSGRGSTRGGRGGRKDGLGRGRSNSSEQDESEDYRARQPSDKGTLWDFVETKLPVKSPPRTSTPPLTSKEPKENELKTQQEPVINHAIEQTQEMVEESKSENEPQESAKPQQPSVDRSGSTERTKPDAKPATPQPGKDPKPQRANNEKNKEAEKTGRNVEPSTAPYRDNKQRQYPQRQQQYGGQGRGRGPRGRHDDSRSYNQSLPPRLQKKQQQYHQQHSYDRDRRASIEKESQREKTNSPGSGSSGDGRSSHSPIVESGAQSTHDKTSEEAYHRQQQQRRQKNYPRQPQRQQSGEEYKSNVEQTSGPKQPHYDSPPAQGTYMPNQQGMQHPHYHVEQQQQQHHMYEQHEGAPIIQQDYNYQQTPPPPPPPQQQYPMYQMQTQMGHPQAVMVTQPMTSPSQQHAQTPIPTAQIRWKKGSQCLALRRDGQYYSAKIEHVTPDGQQCMVSFQDFHGGCEMTSVTLLRPFPLMTWTEPNAQSMPVTTMTAVPVYAQPAQVAMVPRPQVMVPMQAQPPFPMGPKGPIPTQAPVPPQGLPQPPPGMQWQPAQMNYQDMRQQAYQPLLHYDPMAQANNPANRPAYYQMPPAGTVQFVRGVKELHGQELYPHTGSAGESADNNKGPPTSTVYYNVKSKKTNTRPTQTFYIAPRQQAYGDPSN